ncbi:MAG: DUF5666 domain-containing protein [Acidimicrobiales bacterium]|jgi:hypothetical protein
MNTKKNALKRVAATTALGVGLAAGGAGIASATSTHTAHDATTAPSTAPPAWGDFAGGVITAVSSTSITVKDLDGTSSTYDITSATTFSEGPTTIDASTLAIGQRVGIQLSSASSTSAVNIDVQLPVLFGTVTAVSGDTITISDPEGFSRTIVVDSTTTYTKSSASATLSDVTVGSVISAQGTVDANLTSLDASSVEIGLTGGPGNGPGLAGPGFGPGAGQGPGPMRQ